MEYKEGKEGRGRWIPPWAQECRHLGGCLHPTKDLEGRGFTAEPLEMGKCHQLSESRFHLQVMHRTIESLKPSIIFTQ